MTIRNGIPFLCFGLLGLLTCCAGWAAQSAPAAAGNNDAELQLVVILSRHGVRSPIHKPADYDKYSAAPWPQWDVEPGRLTAHGYELMKLFGAWDRAKLSGQGLLAPSGCGDAAHVTIHADTGERTIDSGKALAEGMFPGCAIPVESAPDSAKDPLFRPLSAGLGHADPALDSAAIAGQIGGDAQNVSAAYRPQLAALDRVLAGCGKVQPVNGKRVSIFDVPADLKPGTNDADLQGPVTTSASIAENLLLEYAQGMTPENTGWGCADGATIRDAMQLWVAAINLELRPAPIARMYASDLLDHIQKTMEQSVTGKPVAGALGKPGDRLLVLVGHDTNIVAVAGALGIDWIIDGRADDAPPGGALVFELWRSHSDGKPFVRLEYTAQTLEQMRQAQTLTPTNPPAQAPIFVPGCSRQDLSCTWDGFAATLRQAIDPAFVSAQP